MTLNLFIKRLQWLFEWHNLKTNDNIHSKLPYRFIRNEENHPIHFWCWQWTPSTCSASNQINIERCNAFFIKLPMKLQFILNEITLNATEPYLITMNYISIHIHRNSMLSIHFIWPNCTRSLMRLKWFINKQQYWLKSYFFLSFMTQACGFD